MDKAKLLEAGLPDVAKARYAVTAENLRSMPENMTALSFGRIDPSAGVIVDPKFPHSTYKAQLRGSYMGRFENPLPVEFIFQDRLLFDPAVQKMRDRPGGIPPQNLRGSLNASIPKSVQVADDLFYENLYRLQEGLPPIPRKKQ